jgi:hypothetical protein
MTWKRKTKKVKQRQLPCTVAVEISREELAMIIVEQKAGGAREVRGRRSRWLRDAASLQCEQGMQELTEALSAMVEEEKLTGGNLNVALSSDFCVTRVLAGETDKMLPELRSLRERSAHYLSLGAGPKEVSQCVRPLDAKNSQAWLTVTNQETLNQVTGAIEAAGMFPSLIEHSMVSVCRAVGRMGGDVAGPVIIIEPSDRGVDLGISYRGQLLFDYRPGGVHSKDHVAEIVEKHLDRIQRYSTRFFKFASGQIRRVFLVGDQADAEFVRLQFADSKTLTAELLNPALICLDWTYDDKIIGDPDFLAPWGSALIENEQLQTPADERGYPDLMDVYRLGRRDPIWPAARRHLWPVAAAAAVGIAIYGVVLVQNSHARGLEQQVTEAENESATASTLKLEIDSAATTTKYLTVLDDELVNPPIHLLLANILKSKPPGVFMNKVTITHPDDAVFTGVAENHQLVYAFEDRLKTIPMLTDVHVEAITDTQIPSSDKAAGFTIKCKFTGFTDQAERKGRNG